MRKQKVINSNCISSTLGLRGGGAIHSNPKQEALRQSTDIQQCCSDEQKWFDTEHEAKGLNANTTCQDEESAAFIFNGSSIGALQLEAFGCVQRYGYNSL